MHFYRSDWPETGRTSPWNLQADNCVQSHRHPDFEVRRIDLAHEVSWALELDVNTFESALYKFPVLELRMTATSLVPGIELLRSSEHCAQLDASIATLLRTALSSTSYVYAKVLAEESLSDALVRTGFAEVEHRRLFTSTNTAHTTSLPDGVQRDAISFCTMQQVPVSLHRSIRSQLEAICQESFHSGGSRHFQDPVLVARLPGSQYIRAIMQLNFESVGVDRIYLAMDTSDGAVCGFCVVGEKFGFQADTYTQLLSATRPTHRRRGVYHGLARLVARSLPPSARLLNVTHVGNHAIQRAYAKVERMRLADTVVLRRLVSP